MISSSRKESSTMDWYLERRDSDPHLGLYGSPRTADYGNWIFNVAHMPKASSGVKLVRITFTNHMTGG